MVQRLKNRYYALELGIQGVVLTTNTYCKLSNEQPVNTWSMTDGFEDPLKKLVTVTRIKASISGVTAWRHK